MCFDSVSYFWGGLKIYKITKQHVWFLGWKLYLVKKEKSLIK